MATRGQRQTSYWQRRAKSKVVVYVATVQFGMRLGVLTGIQGQPRVIKAHEKDADIRSDGEFGSAAPGVRWGDYRG